MNLNQEKAYEIFLNESTLGIAKEDFKNVRELRKKFFEDFELRRYANVREALTN